MATYNLNPGDVAVQDKTLAAATVDIVNFPKPVGVVEVTTDGTADVFVTTDGSTPVVDGAHTLKVLATALPFSGATARPPSSRRFALNGTQLQLISAGTPKYSVEHVDPADS